MDYNYLCNQNKNPMKEKKIAEPDYDFKLEVSQGLSQADDVFFSSEILIIKCISGKARISINTKEHDFATNTNFMLVDGTIFKIIKCSEDFKITILRFSQNFFNEIYPMLNGKAIEVMMCSAPDLYSKKEMEMSDLLFRQLCILYYKKEHTYRDKMVVNLTITYILEIYEQTYKYVQDKLPVIADRRSILVDKFFNLCHKEYTNHHNIEYYANKMNITSRYLYKICKETLHMTPKQCLDYMVSGNAKKMLLTTNLTNQQIANELNFPDQATFGQFFKRNVGMTPSDFRSKFK